MGARTKIEWADASWNPIVGCSVVSPGCTNCYAMRQADRIQRMHEGIHRPHLLAGGGPAPQTHYAGTTQDSNAGPVWTGKVAMAPDDTLTAPLRWKNPRRIFVNSMGDLFHESVPDAWIDRVFAVMALAPQHTFLVLTKRSARMRAYCSDPGTPHRVAKAMDALTASPSPLADERILAVDGFPGYFVSDLGRVLSERGSAQCVHCGQPVERTARARYCSKRCRQNAQYRLRTGKPMLFTATLSEMSPDVGRDGHRRVMLYRDGQTVRELVHRLVLTAFERPAVNGEQGRHSDGDPSNNALANLSWGDQSANWDDRRRHGAFRSYAKLTFEQAAEIRGRFQAGETGVALGREFGISNTQARNIGERHQWAVAAPIQWPLPNCWKGVSAEDQRRADERVPDLNATPAAVRWVSAEPLLGPINFRAIELHDQCWDYLILDALTGKHTGIVNGRKWKPGFESPPPLPAEIASLDWIVVGGESGPKARPMHPAWARDIREQCATAGVPFFFKQWGEWKDGSDFASDAMAITLDGRIVEPTPDGLKAADLVEAVRNPTMMRRVGKARAGRLLDGVEHSGLPKVRS